MNLKIKRLDPDLPLPSYATEGSVGLDLYCSFGCLVLPGSVTMIQTGIAVEIPPGYEGQVRGRSGLGKCGVGIPHGTGTIDSDYRGEVMVMLVNHRDGPGHRIQRGDRIAQLIIAPVARCSVVEVEELSDTERGAGGFGSTGR